VRFCRLGEARALAGPLFLKPVDEKVFKAAVYNRGAEADPTRALADDEPVLVSEPVRWGLEVRAFVCERGDWPLSDNEEAAARALLEELLADPAVALPPALVIDVGEILGQGWAVVEANPAWGSGLCGCDPEEVLGVLRRASVPAAALTADDRPWARASSLVVE
jgi:hypothetical protein